MPITLEIVTPTQLVFRDAVDSFTGPGSVGEFGILPGHRPLLAALRAGVARFSQGGKERRLALGPGFAELDNDRMIILTDKALDPAKLAAEDREQELREAQAQRDKVDADIRAWTGPTTATEFEENRLALDWALARIAALSA
jgi:F-type H+-transporting ATPase subunit epsilon